MVRPRLSEEYHSRNVYLFKRHIDFLTKQRDKSISQILRDLLDKEIEKEKNTFVCTGIFATNVSSYCGFCGQPRSQHPVIGTLTDT